MCAMVHSTLKSIRSFCVYQTAYFKCFPFSSCSLFTREAPFSCAFPSALKKCSPTQGTGRGQLIVYRKKKKWVQSKSQLLHPEGHFRGTSTGVPHSYWSGCSGTVDTLHDAGSHQTRIPCNGLVQRWLQICKNKNNHKSSRFLFIG